MGSGEATRINSPLERRCLRCHGLCVTGLKINRPGRRKVGARWSIDSTLLAACHVQEWDGDDGVGKERWRCPWGKGCLSDRKSTLKMA